jgi:hypothetical protein
MEKGKTGNREWKIGDANPKLARRSQGGQMQGEKEKLGLL